MSEIKLPTINFVQYNNKSRKGTYIKIHEKGKRARVLKYKEGTNIDQYLYAYKENKKGKQLKQLQKEWKEGQGEIQKYIAQLQAQNRISKAIQRGSTVRKNLLEQLGNKAKRDYETRKLLEPLVLDKKLLDIVVQNKDKLRTRFAHGITIWGKKKGSEHETVLAHITDIGNRTLDDVYRDYAQQQELTKGRTLGYDEAKTIGMNLRLGPKNTRKYSEGTITKIEIITTFQRG